MKKLILAALVLTCFSQKALAQDNCAWIPHINSVETDGTHLMIDAGWRYVVSFQPECISLHFDSPVKFESETLCPGDIIRVGNEACWISTIEQK